MPIEVVPPKCMSGTYHEGTFVSCSARNASRFVGLRHGCIGAPFLKVTSN